jgi:ribosomal RNA-processing protein 8
MNSFVFLQLHQLFKMQLWNHQIECLQKTKQHFLNHSKGLVKMFCGSGKSLVITHLIYDYHFPLSVIVVPSIHLITQFNKDYLFSLSSSFSLFTICSKNELPPNEQCSIFTTEENQIESFLLTSQSQPKIILITYQSFEKFTTLIMKNKIHIDFLCFDEAHHICSNGMKNILFESCPSNLEFKSEMECDDSENQTQMSFSELESEQYCDTSFLDLFVNKTLFFTATPINRNGIKMYRSTNQIQIQNNTYEYENEEDSFINKDEPHCGELIYEYMHTQGVYENKLNDFRIRIDLFTQKTNESIFEAISRSILETNNNRVLCFHSRSEIHSDRKSNVKEFSNQENKLLFKKSFDKILHSEFSSLVKKYKKIHFQGITSSTKNKNSILEKFSSTPENEIFVLSSCKIISEGIDTKNANMVCFVDEKQSYVDIIQNIGRICRKHENTKYLSTILIPCYVDVLKYQDCQTDEEKDNVIRNEMSQGGNFDGILNVLSALRQEDPSLFELCLNYPNVFTKKELTKYVQQNGYDLKNEEEELSREEIFQNHDLSYEPEKSEYENFNALSNKINKNIQVITNEEEKEDLVIDNKKEKTEVFIKNENDMFCETVEKNDNCNNKNKKIEKYKRNCKPLIHCNDEIKVLWNIESEIKLNKKIFGGYISSTIVVVNEDEWRIKLNQVQKYIDENNKRPSSTDKNKEINKLGNWIQHQLSNYKLKSQIMKNEEIRIEWEEFINKNQIYFQSNEEEWRSKLFKVQKYIDENKKRPSKSDKNKEIKSFGKWIQNQLTNYKIKKDIMKNEEIRKEWEEFIKKNQIYFQTNEKEWRSNLIQVQKYIDENNKRPSSTDKIKEINKLGNWIQNQLTNYKTKSYIMKNEEIRIEWEEFINKNQIYFQSNEEEWRSNLFQVQKYIDENNKRPSQIDKNEDIKCLGQWIQNQLTNYKIKKDIMKNEEIRKEWEEFIKKNQIYFQTNEKEWRSNLIQVQKYIDENNKRPSSTDKNKEINKLGQWIQHQLSNYKLKSQIMKNEEIRIEWEEFINKNQIYFQSNEWRSNLYQVQKYIDENNKRPSCHDKNKEIKCLGKWIQHQLSNYKSKSQIMKNEEIRKEWEEFINKNQIYFQSNEEEWRSNLIQVQKYIDENNKRPSTYDKNKEINKLGQWIQHQLSNYKSKSQIMKNEEIRIEWEEFINKNQIYLNILKPLQKKSNELKIPKPKENKQIKETPIERKQRFKSKISELHQKYIIMNSKNLHEQFQTNTQLWYEYHDILKENESSFEEENIPRNRIIKELEKIKTKRTIQIADLGCGLAKISNHFQNHSKFHFINYDHISCDEKVISQDITNLPDEEYSIEIAILCMSLWGSNCKDAIKEAYRILETGGKLYIIEPSKRWIQFDTMENKLKTSLEQSGFKIKEEQIDKFSFFICVKE